MAPSTAAPGESFCAGTARTRSPTSWQRTTARAAFVSTATSNKLTGTDAVRNGLGGYLVNADKNTFKDTMAASNTKPGYSVGGDRNKIKDSTASANEIGFRFSGNDNKLEKSTAFTNLDGPDGDGVLVTGLDNTIKQVRSIMNSGHGVRVSDTASSTKVTRCVAGGNVEDDAEDGAIDCGTSCAEGNRRRIPGEGPTLGVT